MTGDDMIIRRAEVAGGDAVALSHSLHAEPELSYEEHRSAAKVAGLLQEHGFKVEQGVCGLPTALSATRGSGELVVGLCVEYDALPGLGHACGHNVSAGASVTAALVLAEMADDLGIEVRVLGTPAEETGGGKVQMLDEGAFDDVAMAMMAHAWTSDLIGITALAAGGLEVAYTGRSAHAVAAPHEGVNAADALMIAQVAISAYRQQMTPGGHVHGITRSGGTAVNVIPDRASGGYDCRANDLKALGALKRRIHDCFAAGALATGATMDLEELGYDFADLREDPLLVDTYIDAARAVGRPVEKADPSVVLGSTDMGNVSHYVPSIHPMMGYAPPGVGLHTLELAAVGASKEADRAVVEAGAAMAATAARAATDPELRATLLTRCAERPLVSASSRHARAELEIPTAAHAGV